MAERIIHLNEFLVKDLAPGKMIQRIVGETYVCVYNVDGAFYATQDERGHAGGPLHRANLKARTLPAHGMAHASTSPRARFSRSRRAERLRSFVSPSMATSGVWKIPLCTRIHVD